jgi:hypothetical protein
VHLARIARILQGERARQHLVDVASLASTGVVFALYGFVLGLFNRYDAGQQFIKVAGLELLFLLALVLGARLFQSERPSVWVLRAELFGALAVIAWKLAHAAPVVRESFPIWGKDAGTATERAVRALAGGRNPYAEHITSGSSTIHGYRDGPGMLLGYALAAALPGGIGVKLSNAAFLAASLVLLVAWTRKGVPATRGGVARVATAATMCSLLLLPDVLYEQLFRRGATDLFPAVLVLASLVCIQRGRWFGAGLAAGLSLVTLPIPGALLVALLVRPRVSARLVFGMAVGVLPCLPFLLWNAPAFVRSYSLFSTRVDFDPSSLYAVIPPEIHWVLPSIQIAALLCAFLHARQRPLESFEVSYGFTLLALVFELTYREMHPNQLLWLLPTLALLLGYRRHSVVAVGRWLAESPSVTASD